MAKPFISDRAVNLVFIYNAVMELFKNKIQGLLSFERSVINDLDVRFHNTRQTSLYFLLKHILFFIFILVIFMDVSSC